VPHAHVGNVPQTHASGDVHAGTGDHHLAADVHADAVSAGAAGLAVPLLQDGLRSEHPKLRLRCNGERLHDDIYGQIRLR